MLQKKAMLVFLKVGYWRATKCDKKASRKTAEMNNADPNRIRTSKDLVQRDALGKVGAKYEAIKRFFYDHTRPWENNVGILKNTAYDEFMKRLQELKMDADAATEDFLPLYPSLYEEAKEGLGDMFNPADYPNPSDLRRKFYVSVKFMPIPSGDDFRVEGLDEKDIEDLKKNIEQDTKNTISEVIKGTYKDIHRMVSHMAEQLEDPEEGKKKRIHDSLVENMREMVSRLSHLNITDDPDLEKIRKEMEDKLTRHDADVLKDDVKVRSDVRTAAEDLAKTLEGYF